MINNRASILPIKKIDGIYHPASAEDVQTLVKYAINNKLKVRVAGAEHSPQASIFSKNDHEVRMKLDGMLKNVDFIEKKEDYAIVEVGAGCYIGINPEDPASNEKNSLVYQLDQQGYALPQLGGITHQSFGGFLGTGSSGGSMTESLHKTIQSIRYVDGRGQLQEITADNPKFYGFVASVGLLGPTVSYTIKVPRRYLVKGNEKNCLFQDSCLVPDQKGYTKLKEALTQNKFAHYLWYPLSSRVVEYNATAIPYDEKITKKPYHHVLQSSFKAKGAEYSLRFADKILQWDYAFTAKIVGFMQSLFVPVTDSNSHQEFCDDSFNALPTDNLTYGLDGPMKVSFSELWFPVEQTDEVMNRLTKLFKEKPKTAGNLFTEIYASPESPFWLSPSYGCNVIRIDLVWFEKNSSDKEKFFGVFYEALHDVKGLRFHEGKHIPESGKQYGNYKFNVEELQKNIPLLNDFLKLREIIDPEQIFVTDYWRKLYSIPSLRQAEEKIQIGEKKQETYSGLKLFSDSTAYPTSLSAAEEQIKKNIKL